MERRRRRYDQRQLEWDEGGCYGGRFDGLRGDCVPTGPLDGIRDYCVEQTTTRKELKKASSQYHNGSQLYDAIDLK